MASSKVGVALHSDYQQETIYVGYRLVLPQEIMDHTEKDGCLMEETANELIRTIRLLIQKGYADGQLYESVKKRSS